MVAHENPFVHRVLRQLLLPPFRFLPGAIWLYFSLCFYFHPESAIWNYKLVDNDDYMYLVQAIDWIKGHAWFDPIQARINPPDGAPTYYSPLMNVVYGLPILFFSNYLNILDAATLTSAIFPLLYLAIFLGAVRLIAIPFVGREWANITAYISLFCMSLMLQFSPGRVDHRGIEQLFAMIIFGFISKSVAETSQKRWPIVAGLLLALALSIALEILPFLLLTASWLGLLALLHGKDAARQGVLFSATLFVAALALLFVAKAPGNRLDLDVGSYSVTYVSLTFGILVCFFTIFLSSSFKSLWLRFALTSFIGILSSTVFFFTFPAIQLGPFGSSDPTVVRIIFDHSSEAWPLLSGGPYSRSAVLPVLALMSLILSFKKTAIRDQWLLGFLFIVISFTYLGALFFHQRLIIFAETFSIIPLTMLIKYVYQNSRKWRDRALANGVLVFVVLLVGPLTTVMVPVMAHPRMENFGALYFPVQITHVPCDMSGVITLLNSDYGSYPHIIMNTMGQSTELLFRTPNSILASPFHTNTQGNLDSYDFFTATDPTEAEAIVRARGADLVVMCRHLEDIYKSLNGKATFSEQLVGGLIPPWLKPNNYAYLDNIMLFEVLPSQ